MPQFVTCKTFTNSILTKLQQFKHSICPFFCYSTSHSNAFLGEKPLFHHQYSHTWNTINFHILFIDVSVNTQFGFKEGGLRPCHSVHYDNLQSPACQWEMPRLRQTLSYITDSLRTLWPFFRFPLCIQHRIIKKKMFSTEHIFGICSFWFRVTCSPRQPLPYLSSKQWQTLVRHYKASLWLWQQRSKQTAENKSHCWCLTASIIAPFGDLVSVSGWKNLWDICWGCWMLFDISQCCLWSESGRLES